MAGCIYKELLAATDSRAPFALGILAGVKGSSPQKRGAKAIFFDDGRIAGTMGGGCLEAEVRRRAFECMKTGSAAKFDLVLDHDFGWDDGLICGGKVTCILLPNPREARGIWEVAAARTREFVWSVGADFSLAPLPVPGSIYQESVRPRESLWIAGAGHIGRAVAELAHKLDFKVTVFDDRPELARREFYPDGVELVVDHWDRLLAGDLPEVPTLGLIVTRGHKHDARVLSRWVGQPFAFLAMIGSSRKRRIIFNHFLAEGIATAEMLDRVQCPAGLPIGGVSVDEIAVSIAAQLIQNRAKRAAEREAAARTGSA